MNPSSLDRGRGSFRDGRWSESYALFKAADNETPLEPADLERLAMAAGLTGDDATADESWTRAHNERLARGEAEAAVRCAFWLAFGLLNRGEHGRGSGWLTRARRILDDGDLDCVEQGYLLLPVGLRSVMQGDAAGAVSTFERAAGIAERFGDADLVALARHGQGRSLIRLGAVAEGLALLDEVMVTVTGGDLSPIVVGDVYCSVIEGCHEVFDIGRAQEWTSALSEWCASRPDLVPYRGQCMGRRAEIMQLRGAWRDALDEAKRAGERLSQPQAQPAVGAAYHQQAELHRLRGEFDEAEEAWRSATQWSSGPHPGLALLRLAQRQTDAARSAIRRVAEEAKDRRTRSRVLGPYVEIMLAAGDPQAARTAADELRQIASDLGAPLLEAIALYTDASVLLAEGRPADALASLRDALARWQILGARYDVARSRVLIGLACRQLGDSEAAAIVHQG
jgi:tetratricopeptide (TPR) repeat protein